MTKLANPPSLADHAREEAAWLSNKIRQSKLSPFSEIHLVTPTLARIMLSKNESNRKIKPAKLNQYVSDMKEGRWHFNMENIIFAVSGQLNDGQHRLQAIIDSGIPQKLNITFGANRGSRYSIDTGAMRGANDHLTISGYAHSSQVSGVARMVIAYEATGKETLGRTNDVSTQAVLERVHGDRLLVDCANWAASNIRYLSAMAPTSIMGFSYYLFSKLNKSKAKEFMESLRDGLNLNEKSPIYQARTRLMVSRGMSNVEKAETLMRGFLLYVKGLEASSIRLYRKLPTMELK